MFENLMIGLLFLALLYYSMHLEREKEYDWTECPLAYQSRSKCRKWLEHDQYLGGISE